MPTFIGYGAFKHWIPQTAGTHTGVSYADSFTASNLRRTTPKTARYDGAPPHGTRQAVTARAVAEGGTACCDGRRHSSPAWSVQPQRATTLALFVL